MRRSIGGAFAALAALGASCAALATTGEALRVCAAKNEMPYSNEAREGFENRLAQVLSGRLKRPVEFVWSERAAVYLVKDLLDAGKCEVVMGLDTGDVRVLTTRPYYRSSYVFVYRQDRGLDITDWNSPDLMNLHTFAVPQGTPADLLLRKLGKYEENVNYMYSLIDFKSRRNQYVRFDSARLVNEVVDGKADIAILWGPEAARYVKQSPVPLVMVPIPDFIGNDGETVEFEYNQSMGVRTGDSQLLEQINQAIAAAASEIRAVLADEGIPLVPMTIADAPAITRRDSTDEHEKGQAN
jgi:mxaJ protein